jgi:hypothetical protein
MRGNRLRFRQLTKEHKSILCNGCGGKGGWINPPEFLFNASCNQHDFYYWRGGNEDDRKNADDSFYEFMKKDVSEASYFKRPFYAMTAWAYYISVRKVGHKFFHYSESQKTREDLFNLIKESEKSKEDETTSA